MKNKTRNILIVIMTILSMVAMCSTTFAVSVEKYKLSGEPSLPADGILIKTIGRIMGAITTIGIIVSIVAVIILGMRYMAASLEERAQYKKTIIPILIGMFILFTLATIISVIYNLVTNVQS